MSFIFDIIEKNVKEDVYIGCCYELFPLAHWTGMREV